MIRRLACLGLLMLLAGCGGSAPTHFYTLAPIPPNGSPAERSGPAVSVGPVALPPALDRDSFVTRAGPERLDISGQNRWAAPLGGIVRRVLAADLASRMPGTDVIAPGDPMPAGRVMTIDVNLRQFVGDADGRVILDVDWTVHGSEAAHRVSLTRQAASGHAGAIAAAMSALLAELSDRIAVEISRPGAARPH